MFLTMPATSPAVISEVSSVREQCSAPKRSICCLMSRSFDSLSE